MNFKSITDEEWDATAGRGDRRHGGWMADLFAAIQLGPVSIELDGRETRNVRTLLRILARRCGVSIITRTSKDGQSLLVRLQPE